MDLVGAPLSRFMGLESMKLAFGNRVSPSESQPKVWGSLPVFPFKARLQFFTHYIRETGRGLVHVSVPAVPLGA